MNTLKKCAIALFCAVAVSGCWSIGSYDTNWENRYVNYQHRSLQSWEGADKDEVVLEWGAPQNAYKSSERLVLFDYTQGPGAEVVTTSSSSGSDLDLGSLFGTATGVSGIGTSSSSTSGKSKVTVNPRTCQTTFSFLDGKVAKVKNTGDWCFNQQRYNEEILSPLSFSSAMLAAATLGISPYVRTPKERGFLAYDCMECWRANPAKKPRTPNMAQ